MKTITKLTAALGALALVAGTASAGRIEGGDRSGFFVPINFDETHNFGSTSFIKSVLITVNDSFTGEVIPSVFILSDPAPVVAIDMVGGTPRTVESVELLDLPGIGRAVRWTFPDANLWSQGERLVFSFVADFVTPTTPTDYFANEEYTFVPTPGAAAMFAGVGVLGMARRRR